mgnify:CR=1 FL=1
MNGMIKWFVRNPVAANLMMLAILIGGLLTIPTFNREIMPSMPSQFISVSVFYPGGDPVEVEDRINIRVEEAISDIEGVVNVQSTASTGRASITAEMATDIDQQKLLNEIKAAVDAINTFPKEAERPVVELIRFKSRSIQVAVMADTDEKSLKQIATQVRDDISKLPGVDYADMLGVREYELGIEISEDAMRRYGLTFDAVANKVRQSSLNTPAGVIRAQGGDISLRTRSQAYTVEDFSKIVLIDDPNGTKVYLGDVANIVDGFEEEPTYSRFNGRPAVLIDVKVTTNPDVVAVSKVVQNYIADSKSVLPSGVELVGWLDLSKTFTNRMEILRNSGIGGLVLVFFLLMLFLRPRIAWWVCIGMLTACMGALWVMPMLGVSMNMISLFAFILVLGMVVDAAIIIGESIHVERENGKVGEEAAIAGAVSVARPVLYAGLTTMVAFSPILFLPGTAAAVMKPLPYVVIATLAFSLIESYFILPAHLAHMKKPKSETGIIRRVQQRVSSGLKWFIKNVYSKFLKKTLEYKLITASVFLAFWLVIFSFVQGGWLRQDFFPEVPNDYIVVKVTLTDGIAFERTEATLNQVEEAAVALNTYFKEARGEAPVLNIQAMAKGATVDVIIDLIETEKRTVPIRDISRQWRILIGDIADAKDFELGYQTWMRDKPLSFVLASNNPETLEAASARLVSEISKFNGVFDVTDTLRSARQELVLDLKPEAETLGVSAQDLARQVRQGFFGEEVQRIPRGKDDVRVKVRYPEKSRQSLETLKDMRIRTDGNASIPFETVADYHFAQGATSIRRLNRKRVVEVTGNIDRKLTNAGEVVRAVTQEIVPQMQKQYPDLEFLLKGDQDEMSKFKLGLLRNGVMTIFAIYILIAVAFRSYIQPILVMAVIPFGYIGAVIGHLLFGLPWSMFSLFGIVATAGVVVNNNLVLVDYINELRARGMELVEAVQVAAASRFRPIVLTTVTTFFGLMPITFQKSPQAQFLIPMAVSLAFGVIVASVVTLLLAPTLYVWLETFRAWIKRITGRAPEPVKAL